MRKRQIFSIIIIGCVFNLMFFCNICVNAASNPYPGNMNSNCTYAAWQKTKDIMGIELPPWGNAWSWYSSAQSAGYSVGTTPKANSIVVFKQAAWNGNYGHVAFVSDYNSATGQIYKMEGNYNGTYHEGWAPAWESDMYGYVYLTQQDKSAPSISNIKIVNRTSNGYDVTCTITDNVGVVRWEFPTWKVSRTSAGCKWYPGWRNGDTYGFTFSDADLEAN